MNGLGRTVASGVDTEVLYNNAKVQLIKDALAAQMSGTRRGGRALGNVKFTSVIERESRSKKRRDADA